MDPDALLHPVGPLPARTYWLRRAVAVAVAVVAVLLLAQWLGGLGDPQVAKNAGNASPASQTPAAVTSRSPSPSAAPSSHPSPSLRPGAPCPDSSLAVTASTDAARYPAGVNPLLTMTVRNVGTVTCTRDLGPGARGLTVRSGADRIWSSDDCEGKATAVVSLAPGASQSYAVRWPRVRSRPACASPGPPPQPGTYRLYAELGGITSAQAVFSLR